LRIESPFKIHAYFIGKPLMSIKFLTNHSSGTPNGAP
jgi:hypothetical protein